MKKIFNLFLIFIIILLVSVSNIKAACNPPECDYRDENNNYVGCSGTEQCIAKCCVTPADGGNDTNTGGSSRTCLATEPTNLQSVRYDQPPYSFGVSWNNGTGGYRNDIYVDPDRTVVRTKCKYNDCFYRANDVTSPKYIYGLVPETLYYYKVVNYRKLICSANSSIEMYLSSCSLIATPSHINQGQSSVLSAHVGTSDEIKRVDFSLRAEDVDKVNLSTASDTTASNGFTTTITAQVAGPTTVVVTATPYFSGGVSSGCSANATITIGEAVSVSGPWWQVWDGDVVTRGKIIPCPFPNLTANIPPGKSAPVSSTSRSVPGFPSASFWWGRSF